MTGRLDDDMESIIDIILQEKSYVFSDYREIEAILEMHDQYGLFTFELGDGRFMICEPRRFGNLAMTVHPTDKLYEHRGIAPFPRKRA